MKKNVAGILMILMMLLSLLMGSTSTALAADTPIVKVLIPVAGVVSKDNYVPYSQATVKMNGNFTVTDSTNPANSASLINGETYTIERVTQGSDSFLVGDVNKSGAVTVSDYADVRLYILNIKELTGEALALADVNKDGSVSVSDYALIRLHILGRKTITDRMEFGKGTGIYVRSSSGENVFSATDLRISSAANTDTIQLLTQRDKYENLNYRGTFRFYMSNNSLMLVNELDVETYLYGVLPHEMANSFPLEALKAQAVTARNYAISSIRTSSNYDLDDTSSYAQVYKGFDGSKDRCIQAVNDTRGKVLKYGSSLLSCFYSASNGGWTEISQHRWSATEKLKAYDQIRFDKFDIDNPESLQERIVLPKSIGDASPIQYQKWIKGTYQTTSESATRAANAMNYLRLCALQAIAEKGYMIDNPEKNIEILGITSMTNKHYDGQHGGKDKYNGTDVTGKNDCKDFLQADVTMRVNAIPVDGTAPEPVDVSFTIEFAALTPGSAYPAFTIESLGMHFVESEGDNWYIYRKRFGHGIGLSQRGAQERARQGHTYEQILDFYYPNYSGYPEVYLESRY